MDLKEALQFQVDMGADAVIASEGIRHQASGIRGEEVGNQGFSEAKAPELKVVENVKKEEKQKLEDGAREIASKCNSLDELREAVNNYKELPLCKTAQNVVFSDGNAQAKIMLIGEAPGAMEDEKGIPFCGDSGQLLDKALSYIGVTRAENLYITNCVFWRPPGNRTPTPIENRTCKPFLEKHIALIKPDILLLCGGNALMTVMGKEHKITKCHGEDLEYKNDFMDKSVRAVPLYHPSLLLRNPPLKREFWADLLKIKESI